jgi:hypothetical protein
MLERRRLGALGEPSGFSTVGPDARTTAGKTRHVMTTRKELKAFPPTACSSPWRVLKTSQAVILRFLRMAFLEIFQHSARLAESRLDLRNPQIPAPQR